MVNSQDNYITTTILTIARLIKFSLQIVVILIYQSYIIYLVCRIAEVILIWIITDIVVWRKHGDIIKLHETVDTDTKKQIVRNVKAMFMHKIGTGMVITIDNLIISGFIGVVILGKYSNYTTISTMVTSIISLFFTPLTTVVGHLCAQGSTQEKRRYFEHFYSMNYIMGVVFFLGYYAIIDNLIRICFGNGLELSRPVSFIITYNSFLLYMKNATLLFRNASGTFYHIRWKPLAESIVNLFLSLLFITIFPEEYRIVGVIAATIIITLLMEFTVDPYVVFKHVFEQPFRGFLCRNYLYVAVFAVSLIAMTFLRQDQDNDFMGILVNGFISVGISVVSLAAVAVFDSKFRKEIGALRNIKEEQ